MSGTEIRQQFIDFFVERGHAHVPSSPVVPADDPTLLFANAGMNQFKGLFLGTEKRDYSRAASTQKCIRVSGKHNDLEEVGRDGTHHTFFEMLGNWSFGDYYKTEAIAWAWELLTDVYGIDPARLTPTVHLTDDEADAIWRKTVPGTEVLRFDKDNFWEMGETGPCGPCSEIHYDYGPDGCMRPDEPGHVCEVNGTCGRYVEIWNLVFIQYNQDSSGERTELPAKHVDTGMGLERLVAVLQGKSSNYETDLLWPLIQRIAEKTGKPYDPGEAGTPHRVIADHTRALAFAIADGAIPSNEGRGYVVRRILRRASRFARQLDAHEPLIHELVGQVVADLGEVFPSVKDEREQIEMLIRSEEERFGETLDQGLKIFADVVERLRKRDRDTISGKDAFLLYDTYGFPLDLTELMAREEGLEVDTEEFHRQMGRQRERSREAAAEAGGAANLEEELGPNIITSAGGTTCFLGYGATEGRASVVAVKEMEHRGDPVVAVVLDETPFYAESGGQVGDTGEIRGDDFVFRVSDTQKVGDGLIVHLGRFEDGTARPGTEVQAVVDGPRRQRVARNHTGTHVMHWALRETLGGHVRQQGSLVAPDRLRFDFAHPRKVTQDEVFEIERLVNEKVRRNDEGHTEEMEYQAAIKQGILAFFGDKYGDRVRVVDFGGYSRELCGGTHLHSTGEIGLFLVSTESSIASGVRRVEALTGREAIDSVLKDREVIAEVGKILRASPGDFPTRIESLMKEVKQLRKRPAASASFDAKATSKRLLDGATEIAGVKVVTADLPDTAAEDLRRVADSLRAQPEPVAGVLASGIDGKVVLLAFVPEDLARQKKLHAGNIIKEVAGIVGGGGGGRPEFAQAGGKDPLKIPDALARAAERIEQGLS